MKCGFDQPGCDLEVRIDKTSIETHHRAAGPGRTQQKVVFIVRGKVIFDSHRAQHPEIADELL